MTWLRLADSGSGAPYERLGATVVELAFSQLVENRQRSLVVGVGDQNGELSALDRANAR